MIVVLHNDDEPLAIAAQKRLGSLIPRLLRMPILAAKDVLDQLLAARDDHGVLFVVGRETERLAEAIQRLRQATLKEIVAVSQEGDAQRILRLIRAGASDYFNLTASSDAELASIVDQLQERNFKSRPLGKVIGLTSASGGCGASTLAVNLSWALAEKSQAVCMIDLDPRGGELATLLNLHPTHTITDLCTLNRKIDLSAIEGAVVQSRPNLSLIAAPVLLSEASNHPLPAIEQILGLARSQYSHVVLDLGDAALPEQLHYMLDCDLLVVVMRLEFPCILRTREHLRLLQDQGIEPSRIQLVANRCLKRELLPRKKIIEALGASICAFVPEETELLQTAVNVGSPVLHEAPHSKYAKAIKDLVYGTWA